MPFIKLYSLEEDGNTVGVDANSSRVGVDANSSRGRQPSQRLLYLAVRRYETGRSVLIGEMF